MSQKCQTMGYEFKNLKKVKLANGRVKISFFNVQELLEYNRSKKYRNFKLSLIRKVFHKQKII